MYKIRITNLANFAREIQFYQINKFVVLAPKKSVDTLCNGGTALNYYMSLQKKHFKVSILNTNVPEETPPEAKVLLNQNPKPEMVPEKPVVTVTKKEEVKEPEPVVEEPKAEEPEVVEEEKKEITIEDLSDRELKDVLIKLGVSTSARARWKLVDLVNLNLPDDAKLSDYIS